MSRTRLLPVAALLGAALAAAGWTAVLTPTHVATDTRLPVAVTATAPPASDPAADLASTTSRTTASPAPVPGPAPDRHPAATGATPATDAATDAVPDAVRDAVHAVDPAATLGAVVLDRRTGRTLLAVNPARQFHSASLVKLLIAVDVLPEEHNEVVRDQVATMLRLSDDALASMFWLRQGGGELVGRTASRIGLRDTEPPDVVGRWGNTEVSARDLVAIYQYILRMAPADRNLIVTALASAPQYASDGFDQWFGIPRGLTQHWAIKQGWSSSATDICLHSTGLVGAHWRYLVVVLTEHPRRTSFAVGTRSATAAAHALQPLISSA